MRSRFHKPKHDPLRREIHRIRIEREVTIEELAEAAGYANHGQLCRWLNHAEGADLPVSRLIKVLERLGLEISLVDSNP